MDTTSVADLRRRSLPTLDSRPSRRDGTEEGGEAASAPRSGWHRLVRRHDMFRVHYHRRCVLLAGSSIAAHSGRLGRFVCGRGTRDMADELLAKEEAVRVSSKSRTTAHLFRVLCHGDMRTFQQGPMPQDVLQKRCHTLALDGIYSKAPRARMGKRHLRIRHEPRMECKPEVVMCMCMYVDGRSSSVTFAERSFGMACPVHVDMVMDMDMDTAGQTDMVSASPTRACHTDACMEVISCHASAFPLCRSVCASRAAAGERC